MSRDGLITVGEIKQLIESVGGKMTEGEARALVHQVRGRESGKQKNSLKILQADRDGDGAIDFSEFSRLWSDIRGEGEVSWNCNGGRGDIIEDCAGGDGDQGGVF